MGITLEAAYHICVDSSCPHYPSNHAGKVVRRIVPCLAQLEETLGHIVLFEHWNQKTKDSDNHKVKTY